MTVNVTSVNDAPAGTEQDGHHARGHGLHVHSGRLRLHRSATTAPANALLAVEDHHAAGRRHADRSTASPSPPASSSRVADITAGQLVFTPAANANGTGYASFTFQVQDDGGTANGGVDLDPSPQHDDHQRDLGQRRAGGHQQDGHHAGRHGLHLHGGRLRLHRSERHAGQRPVWRSKITTLPAAGTLTAQRRRRHRRPVRLGRRHQRRPAACSRRRPTPTARATPASPSRCRTTAARPTAASISIQRRSTMTVNVTAVNDAPGRHEQHGHDARRHGLHLHRGRLRLHRSATTRRPTRCWRSKITTLPAAGTLTAQRRRRHRRPVRLGRRHHRRPARVHAGGQRQRHGLRQLHLPGAGRRRHGQRRRRSRSNAATR